MTRPQPALTPDAVQRFPYGVFFALVTDDAPAVIVAVVDMRQDPDVVRQAYER